MEKKKTDNELFKKLNSKNGSDVVGALEHIKEKGDESYLPGLFDMLSAGKEESIENEIIYILNNLKIKKAAEILAEALQNPAYAGIRKIITTACWQNGLDFAPFLPVFVDLVIDESWEIGFEALTVIDAMENLPDQVIIEQEKAKIELALKTADEQKSYLLNEILKKFE
jgi:hypothetical protein